jgi:hypothetical protein
MQGTLHTWMWIGVALAGGPEPPYMPEAVDATANAESPHRWYWKPMGRNLGVIFVVAVLFNYPWELTQAPLYLGM